MRREFELVGFKYRSASSDAGSSKSPSAASNGAFYLAKTVLRGSVVLQVVCGRIRSSSIYDVVFGKETSIDLVIIDEDGVVQSICEQPVFGIIKDIAILPWNEKFCVGSPQLLGKDLLVVISDSGKLSVLRFCNEMHRFFAVTHVQLSSPGNPKDQIGRMLAVDSNSCFIAASAYEDSLALFSRSASAGSDIIVKRIFCPTDKQGKIDTASGFTSICGTIWSMCFISKVVCQPNKDYNPVLAILLNRRRSYRSELMLIEWNTKEHSLHVIYQYSEPGPLAYHIVEVVPHSYGIMLVFRAGDAIVMDFRDPHNPCFLCRLSLDFTPPSVEEQNFVEETIRIPDIMDEEVIRKNDPMNIDDDSNVKPGSNFVCSWSWNPDTENNPRMIFCADSGELLLIEFLFDSDGVKVSLSDCLYKTLPAKALLWMGDGMVLKVEEGKLVYRSPIQNIAPILDMSVVDYHDEKHDQMFACCGMAPEGSLRVICSGISVERLLKTAPIYQGITGTWSVKMKLADSYHSFLVLSFVEETRVLSVGVSFSDVTDFMGFQPDVCTLACGLVGDGLLVQIHQTAVKLCVPIAAAHPDGIDSLSPTFTSWSPDNMRISLGAVGPNMIVVATSSPCFLFILGIRTISAHHYEIYQMQHVKLQDELSCISIPQRWLEQTSFISRTSNTNGVPLVSLPAGLDISSTFVIGTHKPSVEVLSFTSDTGVSVLAVGYITLANTLGTTTSGCIPQDVRLVLVDRLYVLSGLRNGMLLRFEWPSISTVSSLVSPGVQTFDNSFLCLEQMQNSDSGSIAFSLRAGSSSQRTSPFREIGGYAAEQLSSCSLCSSPDDNSCDGIKLEESEAWHLKSRLFNHLAWNGFYVCDFPNDNSQRVRRLAVGRTRFMIMTLAAHFTRIAVGDCRDGVLFYSYQEDARKLDQVYCDPVQRLVADCTLMDGDTAAVSDRKGSLAILSCLNHLEDNSCPELNLALTCTFYMGEIATRIRKGSFSYKLPADDALRDCQVASNVGDISQNSIMASTLLGSIIIFIPLTREEYDLLEAVQARLVINPLTAPMLGNDHTEYRCLGSMPKAPKALDGDMLAQFLELTSMQQEAVLALPLGAQNTIMFNSKQSPTPITVNQVVRLLERVHYALN
ncbi:unnamed protein product [Withania somnifera]